LVPAALIDTKYFSRVGPIVVAKMQERAEERAKKIQAMSSEGQEELNKSLDEVQNIEPQDDNYEEERKAD